MTRSPYTAAGRIAAKIRKSEQRRDRDISKAEADHIARCAGYIDGASAEARRILEKSEDKLIPMLAEAKPVASEAAETVEAPKPPRPLNPHDCDECINSRSVSGKCDIHAPSDDLSTIAPSLREPVPPRTGVTEKVRA